MKRHISFLIFYISFLVYGSSSVVFAQDMITFPLKLMTYNIRHGAGMDDVIDLDRQAAVINGANPDIIGLQEVDSCVKRSNRVPEAAILGTKTGMHATFGGAIPLTGGKYGVAILSKEVPISYHNTPLPGTEKRTLLVCEFEDYVFACTHLDLNEDSCLASLPIIVEEASKWDKPFFICGDWNVRPSHSFITQLRRKSFRILTSTTEGSGNNTFPANNPTKIIDYIACYPRNAYKSKEASVVINEPVASDHRPVTVEVTLEKEAPVGIKDVVNDGWEMDNSKCSNGKWFDLQGRQMVGGKLPAGIYVDKNRKQLIVIK